MLNYNCSNAQILTVWKMLNIVNGNVIIQIKKYINFILLSFMQSLCKSNFHIWHLEKCFRPNNRGETRDGNWSKPKYRREFPLNIFPRIFRAYWMEHLLFRYLHDAIPKQRGTLYIHKDGIPAQSFLLMPAFAMLLDDRIFSHFALVPKEDIRNIIFYSFPRSLIYLLQTLSNKRYMLFPMIPPILRNTLAGRSPAYSRLSTRTI